MLFVGSGIRAVAKKRGRRPRAVSFANVCVRVTARTHTKPCSHFSCPHTIFACVRNADAFECVNTLDARKKACVRTAAHWRIFVCVEAGRVRLKDIDGV